MAFKLAQSETYQREIEVQIVAESGKVDKHKLKITFKRCTNDELDELKHKPNRDVMKEVVVGWSGVIDDDGAAVPFDEENFERFMQIPAASIAVIKGFWESHHIAREKN
jgi:hypothetical protein